MRLDMHQSRGLLHVVTRTAAAAGVSSSNSPSNAVLSFKMWAAKKQRDKPRLAENAHKPRCIFLQ